MNVAVEVENFRCFSDPGPVGLKPLTVLVGENSAGKSSFLAATRLAFHAAGGRGVLDFNEPPFSLGAFDQIAHMHGGKKGRAKFFKLGIAAPIRLGPHEPAANASAEFFFRKHGAQAELYRQQVSVGGDRIRFEIGADGAGPVLIGNVGANEFSFQFPNDEFQLLSQGIIDLGYLVYRARASIRHGAKSEKIGDDALLSILESFDHRLRNFRRSFTAYPVAMSPIRSKPSRTYQPTSSSPAPDGSHIPLTLAKTYFEDRKRWSSLKKVIDEFGKSSGMFDEIDLKPLGRHESDPFQLRLKLGGALVNIMDVGYGVSQVLPIVVEAALGPRSQLFLLQQPEVHLHPKAQAALATFLAGIMKESRISFVVETHSDYFVNRLLIEIQEKAGLRSDELGILFFNREGRESKIYEIKVDSGGNIVSFPDCYRTFFMGEGRRLLGI